MAEPKEPTQAQDDLEKNLLTKWANLRASVERMGSELKIAEKEEAEAEAVLLEYMQEKQIKSTAKYSGLGFATLVEPKLYARCAEGAREKLFAFLKEIQREDLIKPTVHPATLKSFIGEVIQTGEVQVPDFIEYGYVQGISLYRRP